MMPDVNVQEWLNLVVRWIHVIVGIAWIGSSFFFMWLDAHLEPIPEKKEIKGELWMVHGGGFYHAVKYNLVPGGLPPNLHWFYWEASWTWITGIFLLGIVYYLGTGMLVDPRVADISHGAGVAIGVGALVGGFIVYDLFFRSRLGRKPIGSALFFVAMVGFAYGLSQFLSGRAAYIHVGAMMGTMMAANVWVHIIPGQRQLVRSFESGEKPDPELAHIAKLRSTHNTYLTLPVLFIMISNHFPMTYEHPWRWAVLAVLSVVGAGVRVWFVMRNQGRKNVWLLPAAATAMVALAIVSSPQKAESSGPPVAFAEAHRLIQAHCVQCHSETPTDAVWKQPPLGLVLDTPQQIKAAAAKIDERVVKFKNMPLANQTGMTDDERAVIGRWISQGAPLE